MIAEGPLTQGERVGPRAGCESRHIGVSSGYAFAIFARLARSIVGLTSMVASLRRCSNTVSTLQVIRLDLRRPPRSSGEQLTCTCQDRTDKHQGVKPAWNAQLSDNGAHVALHGSF